MLECENNSPGCIMNSSRTYPHYKESESTNLEKFTILTTTTRPNLLLDPFNQRWENYRAQVFACRAEFSEPAVHDLRVAARRLLAVLEIVQGVAPQRRIRKLRQELKSHLDGFDSLRDTQVMLISVTENIESQPAFAPF